jgi:tRNA pseudouridine55 synthase
VVALVRRTLGVRRVGHGGTLDPLASGLLPILVGRATKFAQRFQDARKVYDALVRFGAETDTDDREGSVTRMANAPSLDAVNLERGVRKFRGVIEQVPPQYAALKVAGRPAYARARAGETMLLAARRVQVDRLEVIEVSPPDVRLLVVCSSGTYVRAIARDLGRAMASAAHLRGLRRLAVGALDVRDAIALDAIRAKGAELADLLRAPNDDLLTLDARFVEAPVSIVIGESSR